jgi:hypothetical protein
LADEKMQFKHSGQESMKRGGHTLWIGVVAGLQIESMDETSGAEGHDANRSSGQSVQRDSKKKRNGKVARDSADDETVKNIRDRRRAIAPEVRAIKERQDLVGVERKMAALGLRQQVDDGRESTRWRHGTQRHCWKMGDKDWNGRCGAWIAGWRTVNGSLNGVAFGVLKMMRVFGGVCRCFWEE